MAAADDSPIPPYLLGVRLTGRAVLVAGGGRVADRRVPALVQAGAEVTVVSPSVTVALEGLVIAGQIRWERRPFRPGDCDGAWLVHACTSDSAVNAAVAAEAEEQRTWCVRSDDRDASAAWTPASGQAGEVRVGVLSGDPRWSAGIRDSVLAGLRSGAIGARRFRHRSGAGQPGARRPGEDEPGEHGRGYQEPPDRRRGDEDPERRPGDEEPQEYRPVRTGRVALVGGGPGDPGLITVRGRQLLAEASVVIADRLAPRSLIDELPPDVEVIDAAKIPYGRGMSQEQINEALVSYARAGELVVRLKGGDPFVFGRGAEEMLACLQAGVPVTVVPGVTSAVAAPAAAGIPVTHRGLAQEFHVVSAHVPPGDERSAVDWAALGASHGTIVLLMAVERIAPIADTLIRHGRPGATPVSLVQDGTLPTQHTLFATLGTVAEQAAIAGIRPPAVMVVGEVVEIAGEIERLLPGALDGAQGAGAAYAVEDAR
jgi:uroporphyrin-III C-methyltransferase / precorrin-2 dehydrogenase / sirohydrochlorin ferrochelatase